VFETLWAAIAAGEGRGADAPTGGDAAAPVSALPSERSRVGPATLPLDDIVGALVHVHFGGALARPAAQRAPAGGASPEPAAGGDAAEGQAGEDSPGLAADEGGDHGSEGGPGLAADEEAYLDGLAWDLLCAFARRASLRRLARNPPHVARQQLAGLQRRAAQLEQQASEELLRVLRGCGVRLNDKEFELLFAHYHTATRRIHYREFAAACEGVSRARLRALEKALARFDARGDGSVAITDLRDGDTGHEAAPGHAAAKGRTDVMLRNISENLDKADEVRRRLAEARLDVDTEGEEPGGGSPGTRAGAAEPHGTPQSAATSPGSADRAAAAPRGAAGAGAGAVPRHELLHALSRKKLEKMFAARRVRVTPPPLVLSGRAASLTPY
jgi:Ca2+-binding EF-hand superfamily protein